MKRTMFWAAMLFAAVTMAACDGDDDNNGGGENPAGGTKQELQGAITTNTTLDPTVEYTITKSVNVKSGATLTIPAGMTIKAAKGFASYILVEQGGKININGTADKPVTITSAEASPAAGDWGGLIINGRSPLTGGVTGSTEISSTIPYGGTDAADNSGTISYLILEYTGAQDPAADDVEHNGLTLNAVGSGTKIENIFIVDGMDDGIEFFGGTVDVSNLLVVNPDDDMFDFTFGYSGTLTNAYGVWEAGHTSGESDPSGVEADGNLDGNQALDATPQSDFTIANMTIDLRNAYDTDLAAQPKKYMQNALRVRRGATATITNGLVMGSGFVENLINLSDSKGGANVASDISISKALAGATNSDFKYDAGKSAADYPEVAIAAGNEGCPTDIFSWTGYTLNAPADTKKELAGAISADMTLDPAMEYTITKSVNVKSGATLTIPAGMTIKAAKGFASYILVEQGGKININGTKDKPVKITSAEASPAAGDWGGLIINGRSPLTGGVTGSTEISSTIPYGGTDAADNSGTISYLILEYTGAQDPAADDVEHNGLTLNAVGSGTTIHDIFVVDGMDDGIEFFGGTVDVSNLLVVNPDDDMFDFTFGYSGTLTNAYGVWEAGHTSGESDPSGVEADGNLDGNQALDAKPQSDFTIVNMTIDLRNAYDTNLAAQPKKYMQNALRVRRGATATITNALVKGSGYVQNFVNLTDGKGGADTDSSISVTNSLSGAVQAEFLPADMTAYPDVAKTAGNTGCAANLFTWTKYAF